MRYPVYKLEKGIGRRHPDKIEGRAENGMYLIPLSVLERMTDQF